MRATASTTSPACCAFRRRCSNSTGRRADDQQPGGRHRNRPREADYRVPPDDGQEDHVEGLPLGTRGGLLFKHNFPQDAEYEFSIKLLRNIVGYLTGLEFAHQVEISIDGERVFVAQVGGEEDNRASDLAMSATADKIDERLKKRVAFVKAGPRMVGVTFIKRNHAESDEPLQPHERNHDLQDMNGLPLIDFVSVTGPYNSKGPGDTPSRRRVFTCQSNQGRTRPPVRGRSSGLARRAYRRPVTNADLEPILQRYADGRAKGTFDNGIEQGLRLILANPKFIFRTETPPSAARHAASHRPRARDAAVVLPLELDPRRSAARRCCTGQTEPTGRARAAGAPHARGSRGRARSSTTSPASG